MRFVSLSEVTAAFCDASGDHRRDAAARFIQSLKARTPQQRRTLAGNVTGMVRNRRRAAAKAR